MINKREADATQLAMLATVVDEYCHRAGIAVGDPARERIGHHIIELFQGGMERPDELLPALDHHYDEWLGEVGSPVPSPDRAPPLGPDDSTPATVRPDDHPTVSPPRFPQRKTPH